MRNVMPDTLAAHTTEVTAVAHMLALIETNISVKTMTAGASRCLRFTTTPRKFTRVIFPLR